MLIIVAISLIVFGVGVHSQLDLNSNQQFDQSSFAYSEHEALPGVLDEWREDLQGNF